MVRNDVEKNNSFIYLDCKLANGPSASQNDKPFILFGGLDTILR